MAKAFPGGNRIDRIKGGRERKKFPNAEYRHLLRLVIATDPTILSGTFNPTSRDGLRGVRRSVHNTLAEANKDTIKNVQWQQYWKQEAA